MSGSIFGQRFCLSSFGESHGPAIGGIIDGCPAGLVLTEQDIQIELNRRKPGQSRYTSQRKEPDEIKILSGIFEGRTTGCPIGFIIQNEDKRTADYEAFKDLFRPGHGDYTFYKKYGHYDYRGGGRSSARETAVRVVGGAIAKKYLKEKCHVSVRGYLAQIGDIKTTDSFSWEQINHNPFFCPSADKVNVIADFIDKLREDRDSIGARVNIVVDNPPLGLGEPVFNKLDAYLAYALMSIPAVKGVEIGDGFQVVNQRGSIHRDPISPQGFLSNHAGGVLGGISTGQSILVSIALKPTSSIPTSIESINKHQESVEVMVKGRHDPCVGIRAVPIAEAMIAMVLMDLYLQHRPVET